MFCPHRPCGFVGAYCMPLFRSTSCLAPLGGCAFLALWVVSCSAFCLGPFVCVSVVCLSLLACLPLLCTCLLCGLCVPPPLHLGSLLCGCGRCGRLPPSPLGCFRVASWPSNFLVLLVPPSGYLVASCDGLVALPYCLECCGALLPRFILLHGSKGLWPCVGYLINPLHHGAYVVVGLCAPSLRYSSS